MNPFDFDPAGRAEVWQQLLPKLEDYYADTQARNASADWDIKEVKQYVRTFQLEQANGLNPVLEHLLKGLDQYSVHTPHPRYFGLFNPRANFASILADLITATYNPQLAAWSHAPLANEIENYIIQALGEKMGYAAKTIDGTFCTGGAEANLTALICALNEAYSAFKEKGLNGISQQPTLYCSAESHHSIVKAAIVTGLGGQAVRSIPVNADLSMDIAALKDQLSADRRDGYSPLLLVGTAGTTGAGAIDDLQALRTIADEEGMWFHVDAAYGGAAVISSKYKSCLAGIELSDSITIDLHKWFSVPMAASLFLTSHRHILHQSFAIQTAYMPPKEGEPDQIVDPYSHSIQWSRRFMGLKIYLPLAIHGWEGYEQLIDQQIELTEELRSMLRAKGWDVKNNSILPIICFSHPALNSDEMTTLVNAINASGKMWLSVYPVSGESTARLCITNYATGMNELQEVIAILDEMKELTIQNQ